MKKNIKITIIINLIGAAITLTAIVLAWVLYGWELALIIFMSLLGNNLERHKK
jgi:hypothetical protein